MFAVLVFLMGGGSRHDIDSVGPLRALAAVFLAVAIWWQTSDSLRKVRVPVILLVALALVMVAQLVPLPHSVWSSLAGRETIVEIDQLLGMPDLARPLTFSPMKTANSLASLVVPLACLLMLALLNAKGVARLRKLVIFAGLVSALLGIAQILLSGSPGLYLYEITNSGSAVGLFSNRNHNALFLNVALLFTLFEDWSRISGNRRAGGVFLIAVQSILVVAVLINASRFGLILLAVAALVFAVRLLLDRRSAHRGGDIKRKRKLMGIAAGTLGIALVGLFVGVTRLPALQRLFGQGFDADQRAQTLPYVIDLLTAHFPWGVGFGAFEQAYRTVEPSELLGPRYLNNAHNDWLQVVIEGGAAAVLLLLAAFFFLAKQLLDLWKARNQDDRDFAVPVLGFLTLLMIAMHSAVDYPLRTPSIMLVAATASFMITLLPAKPKKRVARAPATR